MMNLQTLQAELNEKIQDSRVLANNIQVQNYLVESNDLFDTVDNAETVISQLDNRWQDSDPDEQNSIAKVLGIEKNTPTEQTFTAESKLINLADKEVPYYLRGYLAIENEKDLLLQDNTIVRLKESMLVTPIGTDNFKAVFYDTGLIKFQRKAKHSLILALSIVLGGMIGIIVVCTQNAIIRKKIVPH